MKVLIDGDVLCYACGFSCESHMYIVSAKDRESVTVKYKVEADALYREWESYGCKDIVIDKHIEIPPVSHALHATKEKIHAILERTRASDYCIYLTGTNNFRDNCSPLLDSYKGNRDRDVRPFYFKEIKDYLINIWFAEVVDGMEADDAMGMEQWSAIQDGRSTCICTIDKDLNQIPGLHYNWDKDEIVNVSETDSIRYYYYQMLKGDTTDNIKGIPGIGDKKAWKLVNETAFEQLPFMLEMQYMAAFDGNGLEIMKQTDKLIKIRMTPDDV